MEKHGTQDVPGSGAGAGPPRAHDGGRRCQQEDCTKGEKAAARLTAGRMRRQAVPRGELHQGSSKQHVSLQGAWRRQAAPTRGLPQVS